MSFICHFCGIRYTENRGIRNVTECGEKLCKWCYHGDRQAWVIGIGSECADRMHVPMWDFDHERLSKIRTGLAVTQEKHRLGPIHILQSSPGRNWMAVCFTKLPKLDCIRAVRDCIGIDHAYAACFHYRGHYTLRVSPKRYQTPIRYRETLDSVSGGPESYAHWLAYARMFPEIRDHPLTDPDMDTRIMLEGYRSRHVGDQHETGWDDEPATA